MALLAGRGMRGWRGFLERRAVCGLVTGRRAGYCHCVLLPGVGFVRAARKQGFLFRCRRNLLRPSVPPPPPPSIAPQAAAAELWPERAAALLFAQYFWFRCAALALVAALPRCRPCASSPWLPGRGQTEGSILSALVGTTPSAMQARC
jgi:hypothetical protein